MSGANPFARLVHVNSFVSSGAAIHADSIECPAPRPPIARYTPLAPGSLKLPSELNSMLKQQGTSLQAMMQSTAEWEYMCTLDALLRMSMDGPSPRLPKAVQLINVKDPDAFATFFSDASKDVFSKWLVLFDLLDKVLNCTQTRDRFDANRYVPTLVSVLMQKDTPLFIISKCLDILGLLHDVGERALRVMCTIEDFPRFLADLLDRLWYDEDCRRAVGMCAMMAETCVVLLCNIVIKCCSDNLLQVSYFLLRVLMFSSECVLSAQRQQRLRICAISAFHLHPVAEALQTCALFRFRFQSRPRAAGATSAAFQHHFRQSS